MVGRRHLLCPPPLLSKKSILVPSNANFRVDSARHAAVVTVTPVTQIVGKWQTVRVFRATFLFYVFLRVVCVEKNVISGRIASRS